MALENGNWKIQAFLLSEIVKLKRIVAAAILSSCMLAPCSALAHNGVDHSTGASHSNSGGTEKVEKKSSKGEKKKAKNTNKGINNKATNSKKSKK